MTKTVGEIMLECSYFEYSQEYFDLLKECGEITLMENFIRRQQFLQENGESLKEEMGVCYESVMAGSYFGESVANEDIQLLTESVIGKIFGVISKIWKGICKIFRAIGKFLGVCGDKVEKQDELISDILSGETAGDTGGAPAASGSDTSGSAAAEPASSGGNPNGYHFHWTQNTIQTMTTLAAQLQNVSFSIPKKQPEGLSIKYTYGEGINKAATKDLEAPLQAALAFNGAKVTLNPKDTAVSPERANEIAKKLENPTAAKFYENEKDIRQLMDEINRATRNKNAAVVLTVTANYFREQSKALSEAATAMENATKTMTAANDAANGGASGGNTATKEKRAERLASYYDGNAAAAAGGAGALGADQTSRLVQAYTEINKIMGNTLKVYNDYFGFRTKVIKAYSGKKFSKLRDSATEVIKDADGKKTQIDSGTAISNKDIEDGSGAKGADKAKVQK